MNRSVRVESMAGKKSAKNTLKESVTLSVSAQQFYGYADYYNRVPLFPVLQLTNNGGEAAEGLEVVIEGSDGFLLPFAKQLEEVPFESTVEIAAQNIVSPLYLTELASVTPVSVRVKVLHGEGHCGRKFDAGDGAAVRLLERKERKRRTFGHALSGRRSLTACGSSKKRGSSFRSGMCPANGAGIRKATKTRYGSSARLCLRRSNGSRSNALLPILTATILSPSAISPRS